MKTIRLFLFLPLLMSFSFSPMSQSIYLGKDQKSAKFTVENKSQEKMAIEFSVKKRIMDVNGKESVGTTEKLSVFPPQIIIPPNQKRSIVVNWEGEEDLSTEEAYRVIAEQLPLNLEKPRDKTGINILMKFVGALYVRPANAEPKLKIMEIKSEANHLKIKISNEGNEHQILLNPEIQIGSGSKKVVLETKDLVGLAGMNVLANSQRIFIIKKPGKKIPLGEPVLKIDG